MRLVFLYGPPGVGKLTVARERAALTGFKLFHNHLPRDLVESVFRRGPAPHGLLIRRFRRDVITEAAREGVDLVFTYVYAHPDDADDVRGMIAPVEATGGTVHFVQLTCAREELLARAAAGSRRAHGKLTDPAAVAALLGRYDLDTPVPFADSLRIDTTDLPPAEAAARIAAHYRLPPAPEASA